MASTPDALRGRLSQFLDHIEERAADWGADARTAHFITALALLSYVEGGCRTPESSLAWNVDRGWLEADGGNVILTDTGSAEVERLLREEAWRG